MRALESPCLVLALLLSLSAGAGSPPARPSSAARGKAAPGGKPTSSRHEIRVLLETERGNIELALDEARAPLTVANFLRYVDSGRYDGARFYRTVKPDNQAADPVKIEVIQGGVGPGSEARALPPIPLERTRDTGLKHLDGTLSMARNTPDSASSEFFICIGDQPALDFGGKRNPDGQGFAAFGRVVAGMDVVREIQAAPSQGQQLSPPIKILRAQRIPS